MPLLPPPLTQIVGSAPTLLPVQPEATFTRGMACGTGDLVVAAGATVRLGGTHVYRHACVQGLLKVRAQLTLVAQTVQIGPRGAIRADGVTTDASTDPSCEPAHGAPQPGASGEAAPGSENSSGVASSGGAGGAGGGVVKIVAQRVVVAGQVSANGGTGGEGAEDLPGSPTAGDVPPTMGRGGGDGGGVTIVAGDLQLTGVLAAAGGRGGPDGAEYPGGPSDGRYGQSGHPGCVRLLTKILRADAQYLALPGPLLYGKPLPTDPAPPPSASGNWYAQSTLHTLSAPVLAFWRAHGGRALLGLPLSQPFVEGGQTVQYTERARLVLAGGTVVLSPLGRLLTAGRAFPAIAPVANTGTRLYFPATRHTLSGRFLAFWQQHQGRTLFGPPISEPLREANGDGSGTIYLVQYCANARLEYHPEATDPHYQVELGRLGYEYLHRRGLL
jgi:hypothetical protein